MLRPRLNSNPSEMLLEDSQKPLWILQAKLDVHLSVAFTRLNEIARGERTDTCNKTSISSTPLASAGPWLAPQMGWYGLPRFGP